MVTLETRSRSVTHLTGKQFAHRLCGASHSERRTAGLALATGDLVIDQHTAVQAALLVGVSPVALGHELRPMRRRPVFPPTDREILNFIRFAGADRVLAALDVWTAPATRVAAE